MRTCVLCLVLTHAIAFAQTDFFPIGLFCVDTKIGLAQPTDETTLDEIRGNPQLGYASGFNVIQSYWYKSNIDHVTNGGVLKLLDQAGMYGFKVLVCIPGTLNADSNWSFDYPRDGPHVFQRSVPYYDDALGLVRASKKHAALYGYYLADEPNDVYTKVAIYQKAVSATNLRKAYQKLRTTADSTHPYLISIADYSERPDLWHDNKARTSWRWNKSRSVSIPDPEGGQAFAMDFNYDGSADITLNDTYVVGNNPAWITVLHRLDDQVQTKSAVQMILSCEKDNRTKRRNSLEELRFETYTAIIHGAKGIWYYGYSQTFDGAVDYNNPSPYFVDVLVPLSQELDSLKNILPGATLGSFLWGERHGNAPTASDPALHLVMIAARREAIIIAANVSSHELQSVQINLQTLGVDTAASGFKQLASCVLLFDGRNDQNTASQNPERTISDGVFTDFFGPWMTHVYKFRKQ